MRIAHGTAIAIALATLIPAGIGAAGQETARAVAGGGITAPGWTGKMIRTKKRQGRRSTMPSSRLKAPDCTSPPVRR